MEPEERHRLCWYGRRTDRIPSDPGLHTIVDGHLLYCAHPLFYPVMGYEFDVRNCEQCDVYRPKRPAATPGPY